MKCYLTLADICRAAHLQFVDCASSLCKGDVILLGPLCKLEADTFDSSGHDPWYGVYVHVFLSSQIAHQALLYPHPTVGG